MLTKAFSKNKISKAVLFLAVAAAFVFTERSVRDAYCFSFSYRMKTLYRYLFPAASWLIIAAFAVYIVLRIRSGNTLKGKSLRELAESWVTPVILYILIYVCFFVSTVRYGGSVPRVFDTVLYSLPPMFLAVIMFNSREDSKLYLTAASVFFTAVNALNLIYEIFPTLWDLNPDLAQECFLGYHTQLGFILVFGLAFVLMSENRGLIISYFVLFFANVIVFRQGVLFVAGALVFILILPPVRKRLEKIPSIALLGIVALFFVVLMFALDPVTHFPPVERFLSEYLHKEVTLSGRKYVWEEARNMISEHLLLGRGIGETSAIVESYEIYLWVPTPLHAHNIILQTLLEGGIFTLIPALVMLAVCTRKFDTPLKIVMFAMLMILQSDIDSYYLWYIPAFLCLLGALNDKEKQKSN